MIYLRWTFIGSRVFPFQTGTVGSTTVHGNPVAPGTMCRLREESWKFPTCFTRFCFQWNYVGNMVFHSWHRKPEGSSGNTISIHCGSMNMTHVRRHMWTLNPSKYVWTFKSDQPKSRPPFNVFPILAWSHSWTQDSPLEWILMILVAQSNTNTNLPKLPRPFPGATTHTVHPEMTYINQHPYVASMDAFYMEWNVWCEILKTGTKPIPKTSSDNCWNLLKLTSLQKSVDVSNVFVIIINHPSSQILNCQLKRAR